MFSTKSEVDKHVENCLKKINNESERNVRYLSFAKLYFKIGDYQQARRYVTIYLNVKPESAEAQQLLGHTLEKLGKIDAALEAYRTSLDLDPKQNKLVLKVCELLASDKVNFDQSGARFFCEKAQSIDPNNPSIFPLKEKLILAEGKDPNDVAKLLSRELEERPRDVAMHVRLLRHYLQNNQIREAYEHIREAERKNHSLFVKNLHWYETAAEILVRCQGDTLKGNLNWEFWFLLIGVLDRLVDLSLDERSIGVKTNSEYVSNVFNFDQSLKIASENIKDCPDKNLSQEFLKHYRGQLCLHFVTLVYKQAKKELIKYKEAGEIALPLLFIAYNASPIDLQSLWINHTTEGNRSLVKRWNKEAAYRCSQTGHILSSISKDQKGAVIDKATQATSGLWREKLLKRIFITRDHQSKIKTSHLMTSNEFVTPLIRLPESSELIKYDDTAQLVYPDSLHHHIWIGINRTLPGFKCTVFDGLPYSNKNLINCSAESLNVLDVQAFLYCAVLCAQQQVEQQKYNIYYASDRPNVLPAAVTNQLGTQIQSNWLSSAYKMFTNDYSCDFSEVRLTLIRGIETIRCVGNHGLDVKVLVTLAKIFTERSKTLEKSTEVEQNDARAELYWKTALPLLEKLKNNQTLSYPPNRLFDCKSKDMSQSEIQCYIDDGRLFNAVRLMRKKDYERALGMFDGLKDPYASFYQAQIYKMKAEEQTSRSKESVTSEMRSQNIILLSRARDCLYLTFDRLRDPSVDRRHPLNSQLGTEIDKIERMLSRIDPDTSANRNECDGMSDENMSSLGSTGDHFNYTYGNSSFLNGNTTPKNDNLNLNSTPLRLDVTRREARPSPERLDAQLRQLIASKDTAVNHILEQNKFMMESHRALLDEIRGFKDAVHSLTTSVDDMKGFKTTIDDIKELQKSVHELKNSVDDWKNVTDDVLKMKKDIAELRKDTLKIKSNQISDEDLYGLEEEYSNDYGAAGINSSVPGLTPNLYPNLGRLPQPNPLQYGHPLYHGMYPMFPYPGLGLPQAGSLPYASESQLAELRALNSLPQSLGPSTAYLQPGFAQTGPTQGLTPGSMGLGLPAHPALPQTVLPQPQALSQTVLPQPQAVLPQTTLGQSPRPLLPTTSLFSTLTNTTIPNQNVFASTSVASQLPALGALPTTPFLSSANSSNKAPPINVVITSSDPLPSTKSTPQPILSVTIPPQHLKGAQQKSSQQPHNYQIPMPVSSTITTPSVINQPALAISTQGMLSNVPPPIYSSIDLQSNRNTIFDKAKEGARELNKSNTSFGSMDEHDPCPDFKPIIPLPDEVPVNTGEENETVLFAERAKLYRYTNKEWRERGVGVLKILRDAKTGKVRLLMRRDQVHKICANHFLTKDLTLTPMPNNDSAYIWAANDFADQEIVLEKLCVRFKTPDLAKKFHDVFELAKEEVPEAKKKDESTPVTLMGGFIFTGTPDFQPQQAPVEEAPPVKEVLKLSPFASFSFSKAPTTTPSTVAFSPVPTDFKTVQSNANISQAPQLLDDVEESAEVLFDQKAKLLRFDQAGKEWKEKCVGAMKILKYPDNTIRLLMRSEQVHKICCNHQLLKAMSFSFMAQNAKSLTWYALDYSDGALSPEMLAVKFKTEELAKQFHNIIVSIQRNLDGSNYYIVNHEKKEIKKGEKKSKGNAEPKKAESPGTKQSGWGDKYKPKSGSWTCKTCYIINDSKTVMCVACDTPKNELAVQKEADSAIQFSFGISKNQSPGNGNFNFPTKEEKNDTNAGWGSMFKPPADSWECEVCMLRNTKDKLYCASCETPKDGTVPKKEPVSKGVNLDTPGFSFNFGIPTNTTPISPIATTTISVTPSSTPTTFSFNSAKITPITAVTSNANNSFSFGTALTKSPASTFSFGGTLPENKQFTFSIKSDQPSEGAAEKDKSNFIFGSPQKHTFEFTPRSPRRQSGGHGEEESEGSYVEEEEDNIYFKPVIPLPERVEVKTGEEQEEVLYCHRAKLFRFGEGEWKERGIGDIKILKQSVTGKLRVVMRREQILKICLNHTLTSDIIYTSKDDKTWLFSAPDFSEGEIQHKQFCIRFKNAEVAEGFKNAIDKALNAPGGSEVKSDENDSDVEVVFETEVTPEEEAEAKRLGLPSKFMSYRQLEDCKCDECKKDDILLKDLLAPSKKSESVTSPGSTQSGSTFGTPPLSFTFGTPSSIDVAKKEETVKDLLIKPSLFSAASKVTSSSFSSPALVSAIAQQSAAEKKPEVTSSNSFSNFTFSLNSPSVNTSTPSLFASPSNVSTGSPFVNSPFAAIKTLPLLTFEGFSTGNLFASATPDGSTKTNMFGNITRTTVGSGDAPKIPAETTFTAVTTSGSVGTPPAFGAALFGKVSDDKITSSTPIFGSAQVKPPSLGNTGATLTFGSNTVANTPAPLDCSVKDKKFDDFLKCDPELNFANLAKDSGEVPVFAKTAEENEITTPFAFLGAGAPVFGISKQPIAKIAPQNTSNDADTEDKPEGGGAGAGDEEFDPHYEPIVPLPEAIVVTTGEEDETALFNDRAKLFRYDVALKEWKERGVGQLKVLYHPANHTYRLLLRREQVHKVVLNQLITPDLDIQPMSTNEKAWCWGGYNYSEDDHCLEKLAAKFKTVEISKQFYNTIQSSLEGMRNFAATQKLIPSTLEEYAAGGASGEEDRDTAEEVEGEEEEDLDYYDDGDDDERMVMFKENCTLSEQVSGEWKPVGSGIVTIYYDSEIYGTRITFSDEYAAHSNTLIGINTKMDLVGNSCTWRAVEWMNNLYNWRDLRATFESEEAAERFHITYQEGVTYAEQSDIVDNIPTFESE